MQGSSLFLFIMYSCRTRKYLHLANHALKVQIWTQASVITSIIGMREEGSQLLVLCMYSHRNSNHILFEVRNVSTLSAYTVYQYCTFHKIKAAVLKGKEKKIVDILGCTIWRTILWSRMIWGNSCTEICHMHGLHWTGHGHSHSWVLYGRPTTMCCPSKATYLFKCIVVLHVPFLFVQDCPNSIDMVVPQHLLLQL